MLKLGESNYPTVQIRSNVKNRRVKPQSQRRKRFLKRKVSL